MREQLTERMASQWHPIAAISDLHKRHVFQTELLGHELAVWRADDGYVNVWENRCLHRGSRLSVGINDGAELVCAYHGWRYSSRTAGCTYIPAHPSDAPAQTVCNRVYPVSLKYGLVWAALDQPENTPDIGLPETAEPLVLRSLLVGGSVEAVKGHLEIAEFALPPRVDEAGAEFELEAHPSNPLCYLNCSTDDSVSVRFILQPFDGARTVVHGLYGPAPEDGSRLPVLRHYNTLLTKFREAFESENMVLAEQSGEGFDSPTSVGRNFDSVVAVEVEAEVSKRWEVASGVVGMELRPVEGEFSTFQPGAHLDLHLPNGLTRQYSVINGPGEQGYFQIGIKLEEESRGGSLFLHQEVQEGDRLRISGPHNNFGLRRDVPRTVLLAGGIGVTPLVAMAQSLHRSDLDFSLDYFVQSKEHVAFEERLDGLGAHLQIHTGLSPDETIQIVKEKLGAYDYLSQVYCCGPPPMISAIREQASILGWPPETVHYEYFENQTVLNDESIFQVHLARSGLTLDVESGRTILEVLRENGISLPSSCEQGACGTCEVAVLDGVPFHQDVYLNEAEHESGNRIMTCVSRSHSEQLVLDI